MDLSKLLVKMDMGKLVMAAMEHINMEEVSSEVMKDLKLRDMRLFFVIDDEYSFDFVGMAYSKKSARELKGDYDNELDAKRCARIIELDIEKLIQLAQEMGAVRKIV